MTPFPPTLQLVSPHSPSAWPWHGACEFPHGAIVTRRLRPTKRTRYDAQPLANGPSREDVMVAPTAELSTLPPRLETLLEISHQLSRILPLEKLLGKMAEACGSLLDSDSVGIRVVDGDDLVLKGVWGDAQTAMPNAKIKIGESLTGTVVATGKPLLLSDPANDPRIAPASRAAYLGGHYPARRREHSRLRGGSGGPRASHRRRLQLRSPGRADRDRGTGHPVWRGSDRTHRRVADA